MQKELFYHSFLTPAGNLQLVTNRESLLSVSFLNGSGSHCDRQPEILKNAVQQLSEYFTGKRKIFTLNLQPEGTDFQKKVWNELMKNVPYGEKISYREIAVKLGSEKLSRAVGLANGRNPIAVVIPCHRVIGANGKLTGYAGGLERKRWLLQHEFRNNVQKELLF